MAEPVFIANLGLGVLGLAVCLWHAWGVSERIALLVTATVYGVLLEQLVILAFEAYVYSLSAFILTLGDVPLVIGFGWGAILYSGIQTAGAIGIDDRTQPWFVGLFALHIDLAIDAVAIRIPFWQWTPPGLWFGVPLGNFVGWFLVAMLFAAAWQQVRRRVVPQGLALVALGTGAMLGAVVPLIVLLEGWTTFAETPTTKIVLLSAMLGLAALVVARHGTANATPDARLTAVPALYHLWYLGYGVVLGIFTETPLLLVISLAMLTLTVFLHLGVLPGVRQVDDTLT